jgi:hypothetical protein
LKYSGKLVKIYSTASALYVLTLRLKPSIRVWANMLLEEAMLPGGIATSDEEEILNTDLG